jgi:hypothetical protein
MKRVLRQIRTGAGAFVAVLLIAAPGTMQAQTSTSIVLQIRPAGMCEFSRGTMGSMSFTDPSGGGWTSLKVSVPMELYYPDGPSTVTVTINGVAVGSPVLVANRNPTYFCDGPPAKRC